MRETTDQFGYIVRVLVLVLAGAVAAGCTTYQPRYGHDGVYYDDRYAPARPAHVYAANPVHYPYWSLDYFYFSRYYHPYSVFVGYYDPFYYPYPGWYYGYRPGVRVSLAYHSGYYYPWYGFGLHYHRFRPAHHGYFGYAHRRPIHRGRIHPHPIRRVDSRLIELHRREVAAARSAPVTLSGAVRADQRRAASGQRPVRPPRAGVPHTRTWHQAGVPGRAEGTPSRPARSSRQATRPSSAPARIRSTRPASRTSGGGSARYIERPAGIDLGSIDRSRVEISGSTRGTADSAFPGRRTAPATISRGAVGSPESRPIREPARSARQAAPRGGLAPPPSRPQRSHRGSRGDGPPRSGARTRSVDGGPPPSRPARAGSRASGRESGGRPSRGRRGGG